MSESVMQIKCKCLDWILKEKKKKQDKILNRTKKLSKFQIWGEKQKGLCQQGKKEQETKKHRNRCSLDEVIDDATLRPLQHWGVD